MNELERLTAREAIRECLFRYCRGIDRADEASLRSSYWPDAHDRHGAYDGPVEGFFARVLTAWEASPRNVHQIGNILIEFADDRRAAVESYFLALQRSSGADGTARQVLLAGRYCDLFEKRGEEWRVAKRTVVYDWVDEQVPPQLGEAERFGVRRPIGGPIAEDPIDALRRELGLSSLHD